MPNKEKSSDEIVEGLKRNRYVARLIAIAVVVLAILTYFAEFTGVLEKIIATVGVKYHHVDLERASYDLGVAVTEHSAILFAQSANGLPRARSFLIMSDKQSLPAIGIALDTLGLKLDYKSLDYDPRGYEFSISPASNLLGESVQSLHNAKLLQLYRLGLQVESIRTQGVMSLYDPPGGLADSLRADPSMYSTEDKPFPVREYQDIDKLNSELVKLKLPQVRLIKKGETDTFSPSQIAAEDMGDVKSEIDGLFN